MNTTEKENNLKNRKYRFVYEDTKEGFPPIEGYYYTTLTECDLIDAGINVDETGFVTLATRMYHDETEEHLRYSPDHTCVLKRIESVPYHTKNSEGDVVKQVMEEYMKDADSMSETLCSMIETDELSITMEQMEYLLDWAGDSNFIAPEDIWDMIRPRTHVRFLRAWMDELMRAYYDCGKPGINTISRDAILEEKRQIDLAWKKEQNLHGLTDLALELRGYYNLLMYIYGNPSIFGLREDTNDTSMETEGEESDHEG